MSLHGIPYFGENTQEIEEHIKSLDITDSISYKSLYDLIQSEKSDSKLVVIKEDTNAYFTYLRDIKFNYRDKEVFIPYYSYNTQEIDDIYRKKYKGHILKSDYGIIVRYNYELRKKNLNLEDNSLILYNFTEDKLYTVKFEAWFSEDKFSIQNLYQLYIEYCGNYEDYTIFKHVEGYHYISKSIPGKVNHERELRKLNSLSDYSSTDNAINLNYRDVRNLSQSEYEAKIGINFSNKPYWERLLDFESMLFCILRSEATPDDEKFAEIYARLGKNKQIVKYGNTIKLIFKDYWLNDFNAAVYQRKTWSRI